MAACFLASFDLATAAQLDTDEVRHTERMSYARLKTAAIMAACVAARQAIEAKRQARLRTLIEEEQASARRGFFGWFTRELTDEEAIKSRLDSGFDGVCDVALARGLCGDQLDRIRRLHRLASDTHDPTMLVSADDYDTIAVFYQKGS